MEKIKTGIYIRVSTDEQAKHGFSIRAQKEKLINYAQIKDWEIYNIYIDEGKSGKNLLREGIQKLIDDVKKNIIKNVLVFKIDRLTRSTKDLIDLIEMFQKYSCDFNSLTESIDTSSPTGRMFIKIIGLFAEFERETIVERIKIGLERKVKEGYSLCSSTTSYGYERPKGTKIQQINKDESKIVIKIFEMYLNGKSISYIRNYLNVKKIKTKKNKKWTNKTIINILKNPNYIGCVRYGINTNKYFEKVGKHNKIIDLETYKIVQNKLNNKLKTKEDAYYSNKMQCLCQNNMYTKRTYIKGKCYINYLCKNNKCPIKTISHNYIDKYLNLKERNMIDKKNHVQNKIKKIVIISQKKNLLIIYNPVKELISNFTLIKN